MNAYAAVYHARFRSLLQYRAAAVAGFGTQLFWGLLRVMIFTAFYRSTTAPQPMNLPEVITYLWLSQALIRLLPWDVDADVRAMIRSGTVAYEILRPLDLYGLWFTRALAARSAPTILRAVPMVVFATLFLGMRPPPTVSAAAAFLVAVIGALLLSAAMTALMNISLLWTISGEGVTRMVPSVTLVLSGMLIPLPLFPNWAQTLLNLLPFRGLLDAPFRLCTGNIPSWQVLYVVAHQVAWTIALTLLGRALLARATRRLIVQGG